MNIENRDMAQTSLAPDEVETLVASVPSMGGRKLAKLLQDNAAQLPEGQAIVEVGVWLGAGTLQLALGSLANPARPTIYAYDRFRASNSEVVKADKGGIPLRKKQDTLPIVRQFLDQLQAPIVYHKQPISRISWQDGPIGLYVDDASKGPVEFNHILRKFGPSWVPGETILILMDYGYWRKFDDPEKAKLMQTQRDFVTSHPDNFEVIDEGPIEATSAAIIRYTNAFDFASLPVIRAPLSSRIRGFFRSFF